MHAGRTCATIRATRSRDVRSSKPRRSFSLRTASISSSARFAAPAFFWATAAAGTLSAALHSCARAFTRRGTLDLTKGDAGAAACKGWMLLFDETGT